jgi:hypothetical protein
MVIDTTFLLHQEFLQLLVLFLQVLNTSWLLVVVVVEAMRAVVEVPVVLELMFLDIH